MLFLSAHLLETRRLRYALLPPAGYGALFVALWMGCGQSVWNLAAYLHGSLELAAGYSQAMSPPGRLTTMWLPAASTLLLGAAPAPLSLPEWSLPRRLLRVKHAGLLLLLTWTIFSVGKHAFVRDGFAHAPNFFILAISLPFLLPALFPAYDWKARTRVALLATCVVLGVLGFAENLQLAGIGLGPADVVSVWKTGFLRRVQFIVAPAALKDQLEIQTADIREKWALPRTRARVQDKPIDMVGYEQGVLFLNKLNWKPRPVFQSYSAYTPFLVSTNARFFRREDSPPFVLVRLQPIDGRLPTSEDGQALIEILRRYRPVLIEKYFLLLERLENLGGVAPADLAWEKVIGFDEEASLLDLPDACHIVALKIKPSWEGALRNFAFKAPEVSLKLRTATGATYTFRLIPAMVEEGFLLNPLLLKDSDVLSYYGPSQGERVTSITVTCSATTCYEKNILMSVRTFPKPAP